MKFKGFAEMFLGSEEPKAEEKAEEQAEGATESIPAAPETKTAKVDRRPKVAPKENVGKLPGDVDLTPDHIAAAREELWIEGNQNPTEGEILARARMGVFSTMPEEEVADRVIDSMVAHTGTREKITQSTNTGLKMDFIVDEVRAERAEENARKWEEVDRDQETEEERKREEVARVSSSKAEMSKKTAEIIRAAQEKKERERIEQERKIEEVERVKSLQAEEKRRISEQTAKVVREAAQKKKNEGPTTIDDFLAKHK